MTDIRDHKTVFDAIYEKQRWGKGLGSGEGSDPRYSAKYLRYLTERIPAGATVLDLGCGDHQLYVDFDLSRWNYVGMDVSMTALALAREVSPTASLVIGSAQDPEHMSTVLEMYKPHFIILKDVLMHWTDDEIEKYLRPIAEGFKGTIIAAQNWKYFRTPDKPLRPRTLDRYSWAPIPLDHPTMVELGFRPVAYYPAMRVKCVWERPDDDARASEPTLRL